MFISKFCPMRKISQTDINCLIIKFKLNHDPNLCLLKMSDRPIGGASAVEGLQSTG